MEGPEPRLNIPRIWHVVRGHRARCGALGRPIQPQAAPRVVDGEIQMAHPRPEWGTMCQHVCVEHAELRAHAACNDLQRGGLLLRRRRPRARRAALWTYGERAVVGVECRAPPPRLLLPRVLQGPANFGCHSSLYQCISARGRAFKLVLNWFGYVPVL